ncbi:MAG: hypothetical protein HC936_13835 [Leptolyngbyaceae cyanobacterium SU_3_3]|nr:hypothetical protein [Leptolyngbyaceae cyanobacterium SU_3_3]
MFCKGLPDNRQSTVRVRPRTGTSKLIGCMKPKKWCLFTSMHDRKSTIEVRQTPKI